MCFLLLFLSFFFFYVEDLKTLSLYYCNFIILKWWWWWQHRLWQLVFLKHGFDFYLATEKVHFKVLSISMKQFWTCIFNLMEGKCCLVSKIFFTLHAKKMDPKSLPKMIPFIKLVHLYEQILKFWLNKVSFKRLCLCYVNVHFQTHSPPSLLTNI